MSSIHVKSDIVTQRFRGISAEAGRIVHEGTEWVFWLADWAEKGHYWKVGVYSSYEEARDNVLNNDALSISHMKWIRHISSENRKGPPVPRNKWQDRMLNKLIGLERFWRISKTAIDIAKAIDWLWDVLNLFRADRDRWFSILAVSDRHCTRQKSLSS